MPRRSPVAALAKMDVDGPVHIILKFLRRNRAGVAELVDALDLGSSSREGVGVQVPSPAPSAVVPKGTMA